MQRKLLPNTQNMHQQTSHTEDLITRLRKRAEIRRQISTRKSVQEGKPDRLADLLEEAANEIQVMWTEYRVLAQMVREAENALSSQFDSDKTLP